MVYKILLMCFLVFLSTHFATSLLFKNLNKRTHRHRDLVGLLLNSPVPFCGILEYIQLWELFPQQKPDIPLLVVHYEDLKKNTVDGIKRVSEFLKIPLEESIVQAIAANVDFQHLKKNEHLIYNEEVKKKIFKDGQHSFFRKGIVGDWKNHFTDAQREAFNARFQERLKKSRFLSRYA